MPRSVMISAWPFAVPVERVLVVGGTFDPPHAGHVELIAAWRDVHAPEDGLLFVPAAASPFKVGRVQTPGLQRLEMLRLAIAGGGAKMAAWPDEISRAAAGEPSYTVDTLERLARVAPAATRIVLVMGADQLAQFHRWRSPRRILELAELLVLLRPPMVEKRELQEALVAARDPATGERAWTQGRIGAWLENAVAVDPTYAAISSSAIREAINVSGVRSVKAGWLNERVRSFIEAQGLYRKHEASGTGINDEQDVDDEASGGTPARHE